MFRRSGFLIMVVALAAIASACGSSATTPTTVSSLTVGGSAPAVGGTAQFTSTATLSNGTTQDVTSQATWQSSDPAVATISSGGVVTGMAAGNTLLTATYQSVTASDPITVNTQ